MKTFIKDQSSPLITHGQQKKSCNSLSMLAYKLTQILLILVQISKSPFIFQKYNKLYRDSQFTGKVKIVHLGLHI